MIELKDRNGATVVTVPDGIFPLRFDAWTVYGKKRYYVNITYVPETDPMSVGDKIKSFHMTAEKG